MLDALETLLSLDHHKPWMIVGVAISLIALTVSGVLLARVLV